MVHDIAEKLGLEHLSTGTGKERTICVRKRNKEITKTIEEQPSEETIEEQSSEEILKKETKTTQTKPKKKKKTPVKQKEQNISSQNQVNPVNSIEKQDTVDILEAAIESNKLCNFTGCKQSIQILGKLCYFCGFKYCLTHSMPEIHGKDTCGVEMKRKARSTWLKEGESIVTGQPKPKSLKEKDRQLLQKQLKKKIDTASLNRTQVKKK